MLKKADYITINTFEDESGSASGQTVATRNSCPSGDILIYMGEPTNTTMNLSGPTPVSGTADVCADIPTELNWLPTRA